MLGSDPIAALLGAGTDVRSSQTIWKAYLRKLVAAGASVTMLGPDVVIPDDAGPEVLTALAALLQTYPPGSQMPAEVTGALADFGVVDTEAERVNRRVASYWRHLTVVLGKNLAPELMASGAVTPSAAIHVGASGMVAVSVPDGEGMSRWRSWAAMVSGDPRERHSAPTIVLPTTPGGGVFLFRTDEPVAANIEVTCDGFVIETCELTVPIPPTRQGGKPVMRLGPARMLPDWLRTVIACASRVAVAA